MKKSKSIRIIRVVTRNILMDFVATVQNLLGMNLSFYEKMISEATESINKELDEKKIKMNWYRYEMSQLTNGAVVVMFYGERK